MYTDTFKGRGCAKCPVNQWACDAQYRGPRCEVLRAKAGVDFDPDKTDDMLDYAERRLAEEIKNGTASDINYWCGYRDAAKRMIENEQKN